ncbi:MAG: alpha/beta fold hydrolase [Planctomycetota bacterium]
MAEKTMISERAAPESITTFPAGDGYPLGFRRYPAVGQRRAVVACIHGIQSHAGWYKQSCQRMSEAGLEVFFLDRRGSGINTIDRGHCSSYMQLRDDLFRFIDFVRGECPGAPVILNAISWGGKLAAAALKKRPDLVDGLALLCPGWFAKVKPTLWERIVISGSFVFWPRRPVRVPLSDPRLFTDNPVWQEFLRNDPLSLRKGSSRLLMTSVALTQVVSDAPEKIHVPSLLVLAGQDRIIDNEKVRAFFERFASPDKTVLEYPTAHHTLEFEPDPEPFFRDLIAWIIRVADEKSRQAQ